MYLNCFMLIIFLKGLEYSHGVNLLRNMFACEKNGAVHNIDCLTIDPSPCVSPPCFQPGVVQQENKHQFGLIVYPGFVMVISVSPFQRKFKPEEMINCHQKHIKSGWF